MRITVPSRRALHSFSPEARWFEDYASFAALLGAEVKAGSAARVQLPSGKPLFLAWVKGDQRFRAA